MQDPKNFWSMPPAQQAVYLGQLRAKAEKTDRLETELRVTKARYAWEKLGGDSESWSDDLVKYFDFGDDGSATLDLEAHPGLGRVLSPQEGTPQGTGDGVDYSALPATTPEQRAKIAWLQVNEQRRSAWSGESA